MRITHRIMFEGGPFHGAVRTINAPPPLTTAVNRGEYVCVGRTEAGLFLYRWKGSKPVDRDREYLLNLGDPRCA